MVWLHLSEAIVYLLIAVSPILENVAHLPNNLNWVANVKPFLMWQSVAVIVAIGWGKISLKSLKNIGKIYVIQILLIINDLISNPHLVEDTKWGFGFGIIV